MISNLLKGKTLEEARATLVDAHYFEIFDMVNQMSNIDLDTANEYKAIPKDNVFVFEVVVEDMMDGFSLKSYRIGENTKSDISLVVHQVLLEYYNDYFYEDNDEKAEEMEKLANFIDSIDENTKMVEVSDMLFGDELANIYIKVDGIVTTFDLDDKILSGIK